MDTVWAYVAWVYSCCRPIWMAFNSSCCYYSNSCSAFVVKSCTMSLMSFKSPSVRMTRSSDILVTLDFFLDPPFSCSLGCLMWADVAYGSVSWCSIFSSIFSSILGKRDLVPLSTPHSVPLVNFYVCSVVSHSFWALSMTSFFLFSANCGILSLVSSFFNCTMDFLTLNSRSHVVRYSIDERSSAASVASSVYK